MQYHRRKLSESTLYFVRRLFLILLLISGIGYYHWLWAAPHVASSTLPEVRTISLEYSFSINDIPQTAKRVVCFIPLPVTNNVQKLISYKVKQPWPHREVSDRVLGNTFLRFELNKSLLQKRGKISNSIVFTVQRKEVAVLSRNAPYDVQITPPLKKRFLSPNKMIPLRGKIAEEARKVAGKGSDSLTTLRALYDHIVDSMSYDKTGQGWGRGDAIYACDVRKGNCTDFHSLFIGEARSLGIPSRFTIGIPIPPGKSGKIGGYHCWAESYISGKGWVPIDASEAHKHPEKRNFLFGNLPADRIQFTVGRDIPLPESAVRATNFLIYPHIEIDGKVHSSFSKHFAFREIHG